MVEAPVAVIRATLDRAPPRCQRSSSWGVASSAGCGRLAASLRASFLAAFSIRRSRTVFSRVSFAIVVRFLELEAMTTVPSWAFRRVGDARGGVVRLEGLDVD